MTMELFEENRILREIVKIGFRERRMSYGPDFGSVLDPLVEQLKRQLKPVIPPIEENDLRLLVSGIFDVLDDEDAQRENDRTIEILKAIVKSGLEDRGIDFRIGRMDVLDPEVMRLLPRLNARQVDLNVQEKELDEVLGNLLFEMDQDEGRLLESSANSVR